MDKDHNDSQVSMIIANDSVYYHSAQEVIKKHVISGYDYTQAELEADLCKAAQEWLKNNKTPYKHDPTVLFHHTAVVNALCHQFDYGDEHMELAYKISEEYEK